MYPEERGYPTCGARLPQDGQRGKLKREKHADRPVTQLLVPLDCRRLENHLG
jgi:hypothetical protein